MSIRRHSNFDKTVNTIADRNSIIQKPNGMIVTVLDATADVNAGPGKAAYRYDEDTAAWQLMFSEFKGSMSYTTEELLISSGSVTASNIPTDNIIWDIAVIENDVIVDFPRVEDLNITSGVITGLSAYNGKYLRFTYAYGTAVQQLNSSLYGSDYVNTTYGSQVYASGKFVTNGDAQASRMVLRADTATSATLTSDALAASALNQLPVQAGAVVVFNMLVTAKGTTKNTGFIIEGIVTNNGTVSVDGIIEKLHGTETTWTCTPTADNVNNALSINVTCDEQVQWVASIEAVQTF